MVEALEALRARRRGLRAVHRQRGRGGPARSSAAGSLEGYFDWGPGAVGGFAEDGEVRTRLVEAALRRAADRLGPVDPGEVLVVGDTPLDVEAAHGAGCAALGVATGRHLAADLVACGADHVVGSLDAPEALRLLAG